MRALLAGLPENFRSAVYARNDHSVLDHIAFPMFLRGLSPDLVHIPLNRVPLLMIQPYVVTIHDMANLLFEEEHGELPHAVAALPLPPRPDARQPRHRGLRGHAARRGEHDGRAAGADPPGLQRARPGFSRAPMPTASASEQQRILERYQINYPFLLYAGNIRRHKNMPRLVEAFAVVREQLASHPVYKDLRLVIIGDTISQYPAVRQAVIKSRVEHVVRFLGFVPFETLRCFYETAAAFVFPSRYEGFGLPPLEAMACGTPVVASNVSSLPEVVGDAAILVNPENVFDIARGIRDVLLDEELRRGPDPPRAASRRRDSVGSGPPRQVLEIYREAAGER